MKRSFTSLLAITATLLVAACETIPYNPLVEKTVASYAIAADRHIVSVARAWSRCYENYDADARARDKQYIRARDIGTALTLAMGVDDTKVTSKEALHRALLAIIADGRVDALRSIDEPFRTHLVSLVKPSDGDPTIKMLADVLLARPKSGQAEVDPREAIASAGVELLFAAGENDRTKCTGAAYPQFEDTFYDDWSSRLFAVQQFAKADDALGLCSKVGALVKGHVDKINEDVFKNELSKLKFDNGTECSLATIGGVLVQHENLRRFHEDLIVIDRDNGEKWRDTIAQSVRIAATVENFKKSAAAASGQPL